MNESTLNKYTMHTAAFISGIVSIVSALFWYITIPTGIMAIVFGVKSVRNMGSKLGKAGFIMGIIGLSLFAFIYLSMLFIIIVGY